MSRALHLGGTKMARSVRFIPVLFAAFIGTTLCLSQAALAASVGEASKEEGHRDSGRGFIRTSYAYDLTDLERQTLESIRQIDDYPMYVMTYYGDYGFDEFIKRGHSNYNSVTRYGEGCTCFSSLNRGGNIIYGRNHDWYQCPSVIFFTDPPNGYASISMTIGRDVEAYLADPSVENARELLSVPYFTLDGINEYGVVISGQNVDGEFIYDPEKISLWSYEIRRLVLDYARDLEEAISLILQYNNLNSEGNKLLLSDAYGNSAIIEYFDGEVNVIRNVEPWQVSTNFLVRYAAPDSILDRCWRYQRAYNALESHNGRITEENALSILESVYNYTQRSAVYNQTIGRIRVVAGGKYNQVHTFHLPMIVDLANIKTMASPTRLAAGGRVRLVARVANLSPRPSSPTGINFYLSNKRRLGKRAICIGSRRLPSIESGEKRTIRLRIDLPDDIEPGEYHLISCVNENGRNNDDDEKNNVSVCKKKVIIR